MVMELNIGMASCIIKGNLETIIKMEKVVLPFQIRIILKEYSYVIGKMEYFSHLQSVKMNK